MADRAKGQHTRRNRRRPRLSTHTPHCGYSPVRPIGCEHDGTDTPTVSCLSHHCVPVGNPVARRSSRRDAVLRISAQRHARSTTPDVDPRNSAGMARDGGRPHARISSHTRSVLSVSCAASPRPPSASITSSRIAATCLCSGTVVTGKLCRCGVTPEKLPVKTEVSATLGKTADVALACFSSP